TAARLGGALAGRSSEPRVALFREPYLAACGPEAIRPAAGVLARRPPAGRLGGALQDRPAAEAVQPRRLRRDLAVGDFGGAAHVVAVADGQLAGALLVDQSARVGDGLEVLRTVTGGACGRSAEHERPEDAEHERSPHGFHLRWRDRADSMPAPRPM